MTFSFSPEIHDAEPTAVEVLAAIVVVGVGGTLQDVLVWTKGPPVQLESRVK